MKTTKFLMAILWVITSLYGVSQDCYLPPSGTTFFTSSDPSYGGSNVTGLVTSSSDLNGEWSILSSSGSVQGNLIDRFGRTSSLLYSGSGTITIENNQTNTESAATSSCIQSFEVAPFSSRIFENPNLVNFCPLNVVLVIDESGSIQESGIDDAIRDGVMTFANILINTGSAMALVSFDTNARNIRINGTSDLQEVNANFMAGLGAYLDNTYNPISNESQLIGGTNWQAALTSANSIQNADLILMLTDGNPTFYSVHDPIMGAGVAGDGLRFDLTALYYAQQAANRIKRSGKHICVIGIDIPQSEQALIDISGPTKYRIGQTSEEFFASDYISIESTQISEVFAEVGVRTCGNVMPTLGQWNIINLCLILLIVATIGVKENGLSLG